MTLYTGSRKSAVWLSPYKIMVNNGQQLQAFLLEKLQQLASNDALTVEWGTEYDRLKYRSTDSGRNLYINVRLLRSHDPTAATDPPVTITLVRLIKSSFR